MDLALGADQGGSIRLPACWCGVVGLKPTYGLVPYTGCMSMERSLDHVGPMARNVHDCALLLEVSCASNKPDFELRFSSISLLYLQESHILLYFDANKLLLVCVYVC